MNFYREIAALGSSYRLPTSRAGLCVLILVQKHFRKSLFGFLEQNRNKICCTLKSERNAPNFSQIFMFFREKELINPPNYKERLQER